jgi:hypothetical protein
VEGKDRGITVTGSRNMPGGTQENHERSRFEDSSLVSPEYKPKALSVGPTCSAHEYACKVKMKLSPGTKKAKIKLSL